MGGTEQPGSGEVKGTVRASASPGPNLEERLAFLAAIVDSSDDAIIGKDLSGTIESWNQGAERLYGYSMDEACGKSVRMLLPPGLEEEFQAIMERIQRGERVNHIETLRRKKNGDVVPVSITISPVRNAAGQVVGASTIARDISERKHAESERERLIQKLERALSNMEKLRGLLRVCAWCKKVQHPAGHWSQLETFISRNSDATITHTVCPECEAHLQTGPKGV
jgi:PAS domain S-box-containing protein